MASPNGIAQNEVVSEAISGRENGIAEWQMADGLAERSRFRTPYAICIFGGGSGSDLPPPPFDEKFLHDVVWRGSPTTSVDSDPLPLD